MNKYHPSAIEVGQIYFDHHSETNGTFECGELIVQAADRAIQNAKSDWQPIETAPKTGDRFVCLVPMQYMRGNYKPDICHWEKGLNEPRFIFTGWSSKPQPTHWMPLPEAPHDEGPSLLGGPSTSSPLDRAAQALENLDSSDFHERQTKDYTEMARAVLKAIREPSGGMILAANLEDIQSMHGPEAEITCWQAMIDAALNQ